MLPSRVNAERSRQTRHALLDVGWALFTDSGYIHISTGALVRRVGVSRGGQTPPSPRALPFPEPMDDTPGDRRTKGRA